MALHSHLEGLLSSQVLELVYALHNWLGSLALACLIYFVALTWLHIPTRIGDTFTETVSAVPAHTLLKYLLVGVGKLCLIPIDYLRPFVLKRRGYVHGATIIILMCYLQGYLSLFNIEWWLTDDMYKIHEDWEKGKLEYVNWLRRPWTHPFWELKDMKTIWKSIEIRKRRRMFNDLRQWEIFASRYAMLGEERTKIGDICSIGSTFICFTLLVLVALGLIEPYLQRQFGFSIGEGDGHIDSEDNRIDSYGNNGSDGKGRASAPDIINVERELVKAVAILAGKQDARMFEEQRREREQYDVHYYEVWRDPHRAGVHHGPVKTSVPMCSSLSDMPSSPQNISSQQLSAPVGEHANKSTGAAPQTTSLGNMRVRHRTLSGLFGTSISAIRSFRPPKQTRKNSTSSWETLVSSPGSPSAKLITAPIVSGNVPHTDGNIIRESWRQARNSRWNSRLSKALDKPKKTSSSNPTEGKDENTPSGLTPAGPLDLAALFERLAISSKPRNRRFWGNIIDAALAQEIYRLENSANRPRRIKTRSVAPQTQAEDGTDSWASSSDDENLVEIGDSGSKREGSFGPLNLTAKRGIARKRPSLKTRAKVMRKRKTPVLRQRPQNVGARLYWHTPSSFRLGQSYPRNMQAFAEDEEIAMKNEICPPDQEGRRLPSTPKNSKTTTPRSILKKPDSTPRPSLKVHFSEEKHVPAPPPNFSHFSCPNLGIRSIKDTDGHIVALMENNIEYRIVPPSAPFVAPQQLETRSPIAGRVALDTVAIFGGSYDILERKQKLPCGISRWRGTPIHSKPSRTLSRSHPRQLAWMGFPIFRGLLEKRNDRKTKALLVPSRSESGYNLRGHGVKSRGVKSRGVMIRKRPLMPNSGGYPSKMRRLNGIAVNDVPRKVSLALLYVEKELRKVTDESWEKADKAKALDDISKKKLATVSPQKFVLPSEWRNEMGLRQARGPRGRSNDIFWDYWIEKGSAGREEADLKRWNFSNMLDQVKEVGGNKRKKETMDFTNQEQESSNQPQSDQIPPILGGLLHGAPSQSQTQSIGQHVLEPTGFTRYGNGYNVTANSETQYRNQGQWQQGSIGFAKYANGYSFNLPVGSRNHWQDVQTQPLSQPYQAQYAPNFGISPCTPNTQGFGQGFMNPLMVPVGSQQAFEQYAQSQQHQDGVSQQVGMNANENAFYQHQIQPLQPTAPHFSLIPDYMQVTTSSQSPSYSSTPRFYAPRRMAKVLIHENTPSYDACLNITPPPPIKKPPKRIDATQLVNIPSIPQRVGNSDTLPAEVAKIVSSQRSRDCFDMDMYTPGIAFAASARRKEVEGYIPSLTPGLERVPHGDGITAKALVRAIRKHRKDTDAYRKYAEKRLQKIRRECMEREHGGLGFSRQECDGLRGWVVKNPLSWCRVDSSRGGGTFDGVIYSMVGDYGPKVQGLGRKRPFGN